MPVNSFGSESGTETGVVIMWDRPLSEIPSGWVLCDGNNGTVNMLGKFPKNKSTGESVGSTSGQDSLTLSSSQMDSHNHNGPTNSAGDHSHTLDVDADRGATGDGDNDSGVWRLSGSGGGGTVASAGVHSHTLQSIGDAGGGASIENKPQYYEIAFIKKI